jgi:hypothetical protein
MTTRSDVAAGVPPAMEGGILPPGKTLGIAATCQIFPHICPLARLFPAGLKAPAPRPAGGPPLRGPPAGKPYCCLLKFSAMATASRMDMDLLTVS